MLVSGLEGFNRTKIGLGVAKLDEFDLEDRVRFILEIWRYADRITKSNHEHALKFRETILNEYSDKNKAVHDILRLIDEGALPFWLKKYFKRSSMQENIWI